MHRELAQSAINVLKDFSEVEKLILYGSVLRGDFRRDSDIDIVFIVHDWLRGGCFLDFEGMPKGLHERIQSELDKIHNPQNIKFHVPIYWNFQFERGIELSGKYAHSNRLDCVGKVVYSASD